MKRRVISILLALVMTVMLMPFYYGESYASTNGHTQAEAVAWARNQKGSTYEGSYGYQCVDLVREYYAFLGQAKPTGNANTYLDDTNGHKPPGWTLNYGTTGIQPGDISVWTGGDNGHVAIVVEVGSNSCTVMQQNGDGQGYYKTEASKGNYGTQYFSGITGYIHPDFSSGDSIAPKITNVRIQNVTDTSYKVTFNVWDNVKTALVKYATWTQDANGQDDLVWKEATPGQPTNGTVSMSFTVKTSEHNNEKGRYVTHIYAYDAAGNSDNKVTNAAVGGDCYTPKNTVYSNGKRYDLYETRFGCWTTAKTYCDSIGGYLVCINTSKEQKAIEDLLKAGSREGYWIGSTDQYVEGSWTWVTGESFNYTNWESTQPDNFNGAEHYGMIYRSSAKWNDAEEEMRDSNGTGRFGFICERKHSHEWDAGTVTTKATCTEAGRKIYKCIMCGESIAEDIPATGHAWSEKPTIDKAATYVAAGSKSIHCTVCDAVKKGSEASIPKLKVNPTTLSRITAAKKGFTVKWKKGKSINGYEIQYALNSKFTKGKKSVKVTKAAIVSKKVAKLKAKKKYWVRIRTYKKVSGKAYYSAWSKAKTITTKK